MLPLLLLLHLLIFSQFNPGNCNTSSQKPQLDPGLYVFGDSLADSGNNNWLSSSTAKYNYPPYGVDFPAGIPTGRATNGKTFPDFVAEYLGIPYPPPYRCPYRSKSLTGYNYASAGCGILPDTGHTFGCMNLDTQVRDFKTTVQTELASILINPTQVSQHLSNSIFLFSVGNNDYLANYCYPASNASAIYNPLQFAQLLADGLSQKLQMLYNLGARKAVVLEMGPLGCIPYVRGVNRSDNDTWCDESKNQNATIFNNKLASMLLNLSSTLPGSHFSLAKFYSLQHDAFQNPTHYGLRDGRKPCCKTEKSRPGCKPMRRACPNAKEHLYWDGAHPTEAVVSLMAAKCINDSSFCFPTNLQHLLQSHNISPLLQSA